MAFIIKPLVTSFPVPDTIIEEKKLLATFFLLPAGAGSKFNISFNIRPKIVIMLLLFKLSVWKTSLCL